MLLNKRLSILAGSMLAAGIMATSPVLSDSGSKASIEMADDRSGFVFFVDSADQVLTSRVRVTGPNGYVFEDSSETGDLAWAAESNLPDGIYSWEAIAVTAPHSAPLKAPEPLMAKSAGTLDPQGGESAKTTQAPAQLPSLLRLTPEEYKSVERKSGQFRMREGHAYPIHNIELGDNPQADVTQPNLLIRMADSAINLVFPTAQAQAFTEDVSITTVQPGVIFEDNSSGTGNDWRMRGRDADFYVYDHENLSFPFRILKDAAENSLYVSTFNRIGMGTASPTRPLHISDAAPVILLEDTTDGAGWYMRNTNEARFEINAGLTFDESGGALNSKSNPFTIETPINAAQAEQQDKALYVAANGFVGMGTDDPQQDLHVVGSHLRIEQFSSTWDINPGAQGMWFNRATPSFTDGVMKLQNDAPRNSIVANATGVGIGTDSPVSPFNVVGGEGGLPISTFKRADFPSQIDFTASGGNPQFRFNRNSNLFSVGNSAGGVFKISASGVLGTNDVMSITSNGDMTIAGTLTQGSSRSIKSNIVPLNSSVVLANIASMQFAEWSYNDSPDKRHAGPMAEDFHAAFGLGADNKHIAPGDMAGLSLAAVKALYLENKELKNRLSEIENAILN